MRRIAFILLWMFIAVPVFATRNFYISTSGSNANSGTDTTHPWRYAPDMGGCDNQCAMITPAADDHYIFKGGETWIPDGTFMSPGIPWGFHHNGTPGHPIYYVDTDHAWYTGGSWTKPIFSGDSGVGVYPFVVTFSAIHDFVLNDADFRNIKASADGAGAIIWGLDTSYNVLMTNLYVHGWDTADTVESFHGGIHFVGYSGEPAKRLTVILEDSIVSNAEFTSIKQNGQATSLIGIYRRVIIHDVSSAMNCCTNQFLDSEIYNDSYPAGNVGFDISGTFAHFNGVYISAGDFAVDTATVSGSKFHDIGFGSNTISMNTAEHHTGYILNSLFYGNIPASGAISCEPYDAASDGNVGGTCYIANNVFYMVDFAETNIAIIVQFGDHRHLEYFYSINNYFIGTDKTQDQYTEYVVHPPVRTTNLPMSGAQAPTVATDQGYVQATLWAPQNGGGYTIAAGTDLSAVFTTTFTGATRTAPWDIGPYQWVGTGTPRYIATVGGGGSDSNDGSIGSPFLTIQHCLGIMASGDTCIARGGHYDGFAVGYSYTTTGTSWDSPNTFMGYPGETVTIDCSPLSDRAILFNGIPGGITEQYWILKDFIIDGSNGLHSSGTDGGGLIDGGGNYVRLQNIELSYPPRTGVSNGQHADYWELINLNIHHARTLSTDTGPGVYLKGNYLLIDGGEYHDNTGYGMQIYNGGLPVSYAVVRNTKIYNNYTGHFRDPQHGGGGAVIGSGAGNQFYNNLIYNNFANGLDIDYRCGLFDDNFMTVPCEAYNNSIYGNEQSAITIGKDDPPNCNPYSTPPGGPCTMAIVRNNIVYGNASGVTNIQGILTQSNNLTTNPSYVNAVAGNFHLSPGSSAVGFGANLTSLGIAGLDTDYDGIARPAMAAWAAGALEMPSPTSMTVLPTSGYQSSSVAIVLTGTATSWDMTSTCSFNDPAGITVVSTVYVSATLATCNITIAADAAATFRDVIMTTGAEVELAASSFNVLATPVANGGGLRLRARIR